MQAAVRYTAAQEKLYAELHKQQQAEAAKRKLGTPMLRLMQSR